MVRRDDAVLAVVVDVEAFLCRVGRDVPLRRGGRTHHGAEPVIPRLCEHNPQRDRACSVRSNFDWRGRQRRRIRAVEERELCVSAGVAPGLLDRHCHVERPRPDDVVRNVDRLDGQVGPAEDDGLRLEVVLLPVLQMSADLEAVAAVRPVQGKGGGPFGAGTSKKLRVTTPFPSTRHDLTCTISRCWGRSGPPTRSARSVPDAGKQSLHLERVRARPAAGAPEAKLPSAASAKVRAKARGEEPREDAAPCSSVLPPIVGPTAVVRGGTCRDRS